MKRIGALPALVIGAALLAACGADTDGPQAPSSTQGITAVTPSPTATSSITMTSVPLTPNAADVDPAAYAVEGSPGYYRWSYAHNPLRECSYTSAMNGLAPRITCAAPYPADAPTITAGGFTGQPNAVVLTAEGTQPTITEGAPVTAKDLPVGSRLVFGDLSCTALPDNAISCRSSDSSLTVQNGVLTTS